MRKRKRTKRLFEQFESYPPSLNVKNEVTNLLTQLSQDASDTNASNLGQFGAPSFIYAVTVWSHPERHKCNVSELTLNSN